MVGCAAVNFSTCCMRFDVPSWSKKNPKCLSYHSVCFCQNDPRLGGAQTACRCLVNFEGEMFWRNLSSMDVSENSGTPKSSILIGFSIINHPFWGTPIFGNIHIWGCDDPSLLREVWQMRRGSWKGSKWLGSPLHLEAMNSHLEAEQPYLGDFDHHGH